MQKKKLLSMFEKRVENENILILKLILLAPAMREKSFIQKEKFM